MQYKHALACLYLAWQHHVLQRLHWEEHYIRQQAWDLLPEPMRNNSNTVGT